MTMNMAEFSIRGSFIKFAIRIEIPIHQSTAGCSIYHNRFFRI